MIHHLHTDNLWKPSEVLSGLQIHPSLNINSRSFLEVLKVLVIGSLCHINRTWSVNRKWTEFRVMICLVKCSRNNSFPLVFMPTCKSGENTERMKFCSASSFMPVLLKYSSQSWLSCDIWNIYWWDLFCSFEGCGGGFRVNCDSTSS